ncbi:MAG TPA: hypothetical protein VHE78_01270 [Gemmatimonadaceae bacterium]|nr:hypothetical protein [Gemmatimonadaceae bacterium]
MLSPARAARATWGAVLVIGVLAMVGYLLPWWWQRVTAARDRYVPRAEQHVSG